MPLPVPAAAAYASEALKCDSSPAGNRRCYHRKSVNPGCRYKSITRAPTDCRNALSPMLGINTYAGSYQSGMIRDSVCYEHSTTKAGIPCLAIAFHKIGTPFPKRSIPFWTCSQKGSKHGRRAGLQHGDSITIGSQPPNMLRRTSRRLTCVPR